MSEIRSEKKIDILNQLVSIVVPVRNEELNLRGCLESLIDFRHVVIVDSQSTDLTGVIAHDFHREVIQFKWNGQFPKKRNWILLNYKFLTPWVLFLDADERMTSDFCNELIKVLPMTGHSAFYVQFNNWFMGRILHHGDPFCKTALLKVGQGQYEPHQEDHWSNLDMEIHEQLVVKGTTGVIYARLEHHDKRSMDAYWNKHLDYSHWEAHRYVQLCGGIDFFRDGMRPNVSGLTLRQKIKYRYLATWWLGYVYFILSFIVKSGFLDGRSGFYFAYYKCKYFRKIRENLLHMYDNQGNKS